MTVRRHVVGKTGQPNDLHPLSPTMDMDDVLNGKQVSKNDTPEMGKRWDDGGTKVDSFRKRVYCIYTAGETIILSKFDRKSHMRGIIISSRKNEK